MRRWRLALVILVTLATGWMLCIPDITDNNPSRAAIEYRTAVDGLSEGLYIAGAYFMARGVVTDIDPKGLYQGANSQEGRKVVDPSPAKTYGELLSKGLQFYVNPRLVSRRWSEIGLKEPVLLLRFPVGRVKKLLGMRKDGTRLYQGDARASALNGGS